MNLLLKSTLAIIKVCLRFAFLVLHIVSGGVKIFAASDDKQFTGYRLIHDGVNLISAFLPQVPKELKQYPPQVNNFLIHYSTLRLLLLLSAFLQL